MEHRNFAGDGGWSKGHSHGPDHVRQLPGTEWPERYTEDKLDLFLLEPVFRMQFQYLLNTNYKPGPT